MSIEYKAKIIYGYPLKDNFRSFIPEETLGEYEDLIIYTSIDDDEHMFLGSVLKSVDCGSARWVGAIMPNAPVKNTGRCIDLYLAYPQAFEEDVMSYYLLGVIE